MAGQSRLTAAMLREVAGTNDVISFAVVLAAEGVVIAKFRLSNGREDVFFWSPGIPEHVMASVAAIAGHGRHRDPRRKPGDPRPPVGVVRRMEAERPVIDFDDLAPDGRAPRYMAHGLEVHDLPEAIYLATLIDPARDISQVLRLAPPIAFQLRDDLARLFADRPGG